MSEHIASLPDHPLYGEWDQLLDAARAGDAAALGQMCERLREYLLLVAAAGMGGPLRGKLGSSDVVQQTMLEAHRDFSSFSGKSEPEFRAWMRKLVRHNLVDAARHFGWTQARDVSREVSVEREIRRSALQGDESTASAVVARRERDAVLQQAISRLPERSRRIIELRHRQGLPYAEIAQEMTMTETAARKLWSRTIEALRQDLRSSDDH